MLNASTIKTVRELLEAEIDHAQMSVKMYTADNMQSDVDYWTKRLNDAQAALADFRKFNLTAMLGQLLIDAANMHIAPNAVDDLSYEMLLAAGINEKHAQSLSDCMFELAYFVEPE